MNYEAIEKLMKQMNQSDLTVLEIESEGMKIKMQKKQNEAVVSSNIQKTFEDTPKIAQATEVNVELNDYTEKNENLLKICSPMVGTFYSAVSPKEQALVKKGDRVVKGQTLCIIEAMKLMNEIESEYDGEIVEIYAQNEAMVEYNQPLFGIRV